MIRASSEKLALMKFVVTSVTSDGSTPYLHDHTQASMHEKISKVTKNPSWKYFEGENPNSVQIP